MPSEIKAPGKKLKNTERRTKRKDRLAMFHERNTCHGHHMQVDYLFIKLPLLFLYLAGLAATATSISHAMRITLSLRSSPPKTEPISGYLMFPSCWCASMCLDTDIGAEIMERELRENSHNLHWVGLPGWDRGEREGNTASPTLQSDEIKTEISVGSYMDDESKYIIESLHMPLREKKNLFSLEPQQNFGTHRS